MASTIEAHADLVHEAPMERLILALEERRPAVISVIRSARERLILSLFRCNDYLVVDELAHALRRGVRVEVLLTKRAKGWKQRLGELWELLERLGARVHRYSDAVVKYHAKYIVADDGPALVASLNFTKKCFSRTCDFLHLTRDPDVVGGLVRLFESDSQGCHQQLPADLTDRLVVGPERARAQVTTLLEQARRSIRIIDAKLTDPQIILLLKAQRAAGVQVELLTGKRLGERRSHGKLILVDDSTAVIGSLALAALSLEFRREMALVVRDAVCVGQLKHHFENLAAATGFATEPSWLRQRELSQGTDSKNEGE